MNRLIAAGAAAVVLALLGATSTASGQDEEEGAETPETTAESPKPSFYEVFGEPSKQEPGASETTAESPKPTFYEVFGEQAKREPSPAKKYQGAVLAAARTCQSAGRSMPECWADASPQKCESLVFPALVERGDKLTAWVLCVRSCADASYWSRTFGECKTDIAPVHKPEN